MSTPTILITSLDSVTIDGKQVGSITNAIANKNATPQALHDALTAFHSGAVATATQSATDATNASHEPTYTQISSLLAKGTPDDLKTAKALSDSAATTARTSTKQKKIAVAQAKLEKAQAELAAAQG